MSKSTAHDENSGGSLTRSVKSTIPATSTSKKVGAGRLLFAACLLMVAIALGTVAYFILRGAERELAKKQFDSIADRALDTALEILSRKRLGTITMASIAAQSHPDPDAWPFVTIGGFERIANQLIETSSGRSMSFVPLVQPDQLDEFEDFAYNFFYNERKPPFPNGTAISSFGRGVWAVAGDDQSGRYRVTGTSTQYGSPYQIIAPILQHNTGPAEDLLLLDIHFGQLRGPVVDDILTCSSTRTVDENLEQSRECGSLTDILILVGSEQPGALILEPIFPNEDPEKITGLVSSSVAWQEILETAFPYDVSGIYCIVESDTQAFTYYVSNGISRFQGQGDRHFRKFDKDRHAILLSDGLFSIESSNYTLSLYPSDEFFDVYSTGNPLVATVGAVCIILFTSFLFYLYDYCVRQEFTAKHDLLEAKRKFVRFVSHEVRTPLNSVCMGLTLMQDEISSALENEQRAEAPSNPDNSIARKNATDWLNLAAEVYINAQSSVDVLNDLLNYDKIETGTLSLELTVIPIWKLIESTAAEFRLPAAKKQMRLAIDLGSMASHDEESGGSECTENLSEDMRNRQVIGDSVRITQVLRNLLSNALKFSNEGGKLTVKARWVTEHPTMSHEDKNGSSGKRFVLKNDEVVYCPGSGFIQVAVTDTGAGLSREQLSKLFRHGVQFNVNDLQAGQGSGLGLYISRGIMEQHGGTLSASSPGLGRGTTFTMTLPLYHIQTSRPVNSVVPEDLRARSVSKGTPSPSPTSSDSDESPACMEPAELNILVVDDAVMNRKLLCRILQRRGHKCDQAEDGQIAVDQVKTARESGFFYDLILLDFEMPVMNGPDAAKAIREMGCDSFIVGITGNLLGEDVTYFKSCGANGVLSKPFKLDDLDQLWMEYNVNSNVSFSARSPAR